MIDQVITGEQVVSRKLSTIDFSVIISTVIMGWKSKKRKYLPLSATRVMGSYPGGGALPEKLSRGVRPASQNPIYDQDGDKMAKIDSLFMTKTAEKPYPLGPHILI